MEHVAFLTLFVLLPAAALAEGSYLLRRPNRVLGMSYSPSRRAAFVAVRIGGVLIIVAGLSPLLYFVYVVSTGGFGD